jgi:EmrB/QacA subfamily drug resistance transporter
MTATQSQAEPDPRRWFTLAIVLTAVFITALDSSVLNVAIPTILRDFHTDLPSLQWVLTGYSLTFATLLIIGGKLGDLYGRRRMFMVGNALFGAGSLIAALSTSTPVLVLGEAVIEGIGASLMLPASLAILSTVFKGHERSTAFAAWGAFAGLSGAFGPVIGGFLTSYYSWRWAFGINVIATPLAIAGTLAFMPKDDAAGGRPRLDFPGAALIATGMFLLVFGISEGGTYGWIRQVRPFSIGGASVWPASWSVSVILPAFVVAAAILTRFVLLERDKERRDSAPLFEFGLLRHKRFRYGLATTMIVTLGGFTILIVLPVFLQRARNLSAARNGLWLFPSGVFSVIGAQLGARLTRRIGVTTVVRVGITLQAVGLTIIALSMSPDVSLRRLVVGFAFTGIGGGFSFSQLTSVVLWEIPADKSGVASGANSTSRHIGGALGVAVSGSLLSALTVRYAAGKMAGVAGVSTALKGSALVQLHAKGLGFVVPPGTPAAGGVALRRSFVSGLAAAARVPLLLSAGFVMAGVVVSLLIPTIGPLPAGPREAVAAAEAELELFNPVEPDPSTMVDGYPTAGGEAAVRGD